jgi:hypothetical protein
MRRDEACRWFAHQGDVQEFHSRREEARPWTALHVYSLRRTGDFRNSHLNAVVPLY